MGMTEVDGVDQRNIGNRSNDVFADVYSIKLPLGATRALAGVDKRRDYYKNLRTPFKGDITHEALARIVSPWLEGVRDNFNLTDKYTANGFLLILVNMRWVMLQDCEVLIRKHNMSHFIITHMPTNFELAAFIDYSHQLSVHMAEQEHKMMRELMFFSGTLGKFDDQFKATKEILTEVTKGAVENRVFKGNIKTAVTGSIKKITNYVEKYGEDDEAMDASIDQELRLALPSLLINEYVVGISETTATSKYTVSVTFDSVQCLVDHWDICIYLNEKKHKSQWRTHLKGAQ